MHSILFYYFPSVFNIFWYLSLHCLGTSKRSRFTFGRSKWRTPFLFLLLPSDVILFLWHSESGRTFLWALHCLLLSFLFVSHLPPDYTKPLVLPSSLHFYLRGPHQRHCAFRGQQWQQWCSQLFAIRSRSCCQAFSSNSPKSQQHLCTGTD